MVANVSLLKTQEFLSCFLIVWSVVLLFKKKERKKSGRVSTQLDQVNRVQQVYLLQQVM